MLLLLVFVFILLVYIYLVDARRVYSPTLTLAHNNRNRLLLLVFVIQLINTRNSCSKLPAALINQNRSSRARILYRQNGEWAFEVCFFSRHSVLVRRRFISIHTMLCDFVYILMFLRYCCNVCAVSLNTLTQLAFVRLNRKM